MSPNERRLRSVTIAATIAVIAFSAFSIYEFVSLRPKISYTVDFGALLDSVVLLAVFIFIDYAYSSKSSKDKADTDLLLTIVSEARFAFRSVEQEAQHCRSGRRLTAPESRALMSAERDLEIALHSVEEALKHCSIDLRDVHFEKVKDAGFELKDSLTDSPFPGPYDAHGLARIRTASRLMRDELTRLAFAINHR
jgi:hypothetical protein